jgi:hypothetical protein
MSRSLLAGTLSPSASWLPVVLVRAARCYRARQRSTLHANDQQGARAREGVRRRYDTAGEHEREWQPLPVGKSAPIAPARAQEAVKGPCFELTPPVAQTERPLPFLINRCTGETWMLVRRPVRDSDFVTYESQNRSAIDDAL